MILANVSELREAKLQESAGNLDTERARRRLDAAEAQVRAARQAPEAIRERYEAGVATLYEVTQSRADLVGAESTKVGYV